MNLPRASLALVLLGLSFSSIQATTIYLNSGGSNSGSGAGNTRVFGPVDGFTVTASAESLISPATAWEASYLGQYSGGLGVTNRLENGSSPGHTVDNNSNAIDRVVFSFSAPVILDSAYLSAYGDTDITIYYWASGAWVTLGNNSGSGDRTADFNNGAPAVDASLWAIGAKVGNTDDYVKIKKITFQEGPPRTQVPEAGSSLLMLTGGLGGLVLLSRIFAKGKAIKAVA
jgi:hypothetical protein